MVSLYSASWSHSDTPHSVELLWTSDQSDAGISPWHHTTPTRNKHSYPGEIRTHNLRKQATADPRFRSCGQFVSICCCCLLFCWRYNPSWLYFHSPVADFSLLVFEVSSSHKRRATVGRTPLDEWSIRRRDLYLSTHNIHNRQTSMPPVGFEPTISAGEQP